MPQKNAFPVIFLLFCIMANLTAQTEAESPTFPKSIKPGEVYTVPNSFETGSGQSPITRLWLLTDNQYKTARILAEIELVGTDIERELSRAIAKKDSTILELKTSLEDTKAERQKYIDLWNTSHDDLEECEIKKTKSFKKGFTYGAGASMLLALTLLKIIIP